MAYIIVNTSDDDLAWSNVYGWVEDDYDTFSDDERHTLALPIDGDWVEVPWVKLED